MGTALDTLNATIEREYNSICRFCRRSVYETEDASEIAHESIGKAIYFVRRHPDFEPRTTWRAWLWSITRNTIRDYYRRKKDEFRALGKDKDRVRPEENALEEADKLQRAFPQLATTVDYANNIYAEEMIDLVRQLILSQLTESQRTCLCLRYYEGYTKNEIGSMLWPEQPPHLSAGRANQLITRAKSKLRDVLKLPYYLERIGA